MPYTFYFDGLRLPVTPPKLRLKIKNQNKTLTLINEGEVSILRAPGLTEVSFTARLPQANVPYAPDAQRASVYLDRFNDCKAQKKRVRFLVTRTTPDGRLLFDTNLLVSLEDYTVEEDAGEGGDLLVELSLRQYREYGAKAVKPAPGGGVTTQASRPVAHASAPKSHTVVKGDCLWSIAQKRLGDGSRYRELYELNKSVVDAGNRGTGNTRYTIYPGQTFRLPER